MDPLTTSVVSGIVAASKIYDHVKGRKKDNRLDRIERKLDTALRDTSDRITKVEHLTIGVDGDNGLRADIRSLQDDMDELKRRGAFEPLRPSGA